MRLMMQLSTLQGLHNGKGHTIGANIGTRYSHSKTTKFMDLATHIHFFVNFQVFEWLNHVSLAKIDVHLLITPNHAGVDDLIIQRLVPACNKGNSRLLHSGKTTPGSQHQGLVVCVLVYCEKKNNKQKNKGLYGCDIYLKPSAC